MIAGTTQGRYLGANRTPRRPTLIVLGVIVLAALTLLLVRRDPPRRAAAEVPARAASQPDAAEMPTAIRSRGVVAPKVRLEIMPEVAGKVIYAHSQLRSGGLIRANEKLVEIDSSSYELAVRRARAAVDEAQARLDLELVGKGLRPPQGRLQPPEDQMSLPAVLQEPLIRQAVASLESAQAELAMAELQLSRTSIMLPFDVMIAGETVSLGQYAEVGRPLAVAYGTETFEIEAPVSGEDLDRLGLSDVGQGAESPQRVAEVKAVFAGRERTWLGRVLRTTRRVDPESGMTSIVVEVPEPLKTSADQPALLPGMAVEVLLDDDPSADTPNDVGNVGER
ncbi:MAG TPA: HlyD family efflux transporter periplasmic adaptor subunit [Sedimentisphaerales bacterium]|nr:HlyD family efflux transporter periplasmic adaptor subunit [Sedimentisphaerales bacterium]